MYKVTFEFSPSESESAENYISLREGQSVTKVRELGNGWSAGYNVSTEQTGIFPSNYIEVIKGSVGSIQYDIAGRNIGDLPQRPKQSPRTGTGTGTKNVIKEIRRSIDIGIKEAGNFLSIVQTLQNQISPLTTCS